MGNRAVITTEDEEWGLYTHTHGNRGFVDGALNYARMKYPEWAGPCGRLRILRDIFQNVAGEGGLILGGYTRLDRDNGDNGVYIINSYWEIIGRKYTQYPEESEAYNLLEVMKEIDAKQPHSVGEKRIRKYLNNRM